MSASLRELERVPRQQRACQQQHRTRAHARRRSSPPGGPAGTGGRARRPGRSTARCRRERAARVRGTSSRTVAPDIDGDSGQGEQTADHRAEADPLLALNDDEEEGGERDERQHRLAEAGVNVHRARSRRVRTRRRFRPPRRASRRPALARAATLTRRSAIIAARSVAASAKRRQAPQRGSSSRLLNRIATAFPPARIGHCEERGERGAFVAAVHAPTLRAGARAQGRAEARPPNLARPWRSPPASRRRRFRAAA